MKLAIDAGHGINTAGKRTPDDIREWTLNDRVLRGFEAEIKKYNDVQVVRLDDPTGKTDVSLVNRTNKANAENADYLISFHHNAYTGSWGNHGGTETLIQRSGGKDEELAKTLNDAIVATLGLRNRGVKVQNLHMNRESKAVSCLVEVGFMDSNTDMIIRNAVQGHAVGVNMAVAFANKYGLKLIEDAPTPPETSKKTNAEIAEEVKLGKWGNGDARKAALVNAGYDYYAIQAIINGSSPAPTPPPAPVKKTNVQIADEVINGKWGNDPKRSEDLKKAGYDPVAIQTEVNKKLGGSKPTATPIKKGDKVSVVNNVQYNGGRFSVLRSSYDVIEIKGDRVVIGVGKAVTVAINVVNLKKV